MRVRRSTLIVALATAAVGLLPSRAEAHLVTTGLGPIYDGIGHVLSSPDDLVPALLIGLLAGLNGATAGRRALFAVTAAWFVGGATAFLAGSTILPAAAPTASFLVLGALTAADWRLPPVVVTTFAVALGLVHGTLNGASVAEAGREALGLLGIVGTVFVLAALAAARAASLRAAWARVVVRVVGSWVAAIGLLMLGWQLRPPAIS